MARIARVGARIRASVAQGPQKTARFFGKFDRSIARAGRRGATRRQHPLRQHYPADKQAPFPGDWEMERRIKSYVRWNAMAMVVNANRAHSGLERAYLYLCLGRDFI